MKTWFLVFTALSVSADSFFVGLSLSQRQTDYKSILLGVSGTVFCLATLGAFIGSIVPTALTNLFIVVSGIVLIAIGVLELKKIDTPSLIEEIEKNTLTLSIISGASIGVDGSVGALSLTLIGYNPMIVSLFITIMHLNLLSLSFIVTEKISKHSRLEHLPAWLLICLGTYKIISLFN